MAWSWLTGDEAKYQRMRAAERHEAHGLRCPFGELLDLSTTGLRCRAPGKPGVAKGAVVPLVLQNANQTIRLMARVVWVRKTSLVGGDWQVGLQFLDVRPGIKAAIEQFAKYGFIQNLGSAAANIATEPAPAEKPAASEPKKQQEQPSTQQSAPKSDAKSERYATVEIEDLYKHLGLTIDADEAAILKAYRAIAKKLHPDHNPDPAAQEQFVFINKAYGVLKDPSKRAKYDAMLRASMQGRNASAA